MSTQTVLRLTARDTWEKLAEFQESIPSASKHEVLVRIRSVALNFRDVAISTGKYPFPVKDQVVPASDAAGDVVEVGESVLDISQGDKVVIAFDPATLYGPIKSWATGLGGPVDGVLREYISVPAHAVVKIPETSSLSYSQWASLVCTGATAWNSLYGIAPLKPGKTVLFQGRLRFIIPPTSHNARTNVVLSRNGWCIHHWPCAGKGRWCAHHHYFLV